MAKLTEQEAQVLVDAANAESTRIQRVVNEEIAATTVAIQARHRQAIDAVKAQIVAAREAMRLAKDALPDHPWNGKRVFKHAAAPGRGSWNRQTIRLEGIVETVRSHTEFPLNTASYSRPMIGKPLVRLLAKNGKLGRRFETMNGDHHGWKLVEEPQNDAGVRAISPQGNPAPDDPDPNPLGPKS